MQWGVESPNKSWSVFNLNPTTLHFELRAGDHWPQDHSTSVQRVEIDQSRGKFGGATEEGATGDLSSGYHLAPGDRLTIVVFDQPQLCGDFIVDGRGEMLE